MTYFQVQQRPALGGEPADLRELCTVGKARLLQRRNLPSDYRRTPRRIQAIYSDSYFLSLSKDFMVQGGDPTGTGKGGTSIYGQKLYVTHTHTHRSHLLHRTTDTNHPQSIYSSPPAAKTRSIQNCGSQVPGSSRWPTRDQTPTVRFVRSLP
jgi:cyclophilin family peptidyl-prolyl cis-trans isomerase